MKKIISILLSSLFVISVYAQSADVITEILDSKESTFGQVCYLSAVHQGLLDENASYSDAVNILYENGQISTVYNEQESVPVITAVYIISQIWEIKGGLMYRLTKGAPRYAFRQFQTDGIIGKSVEPKSLISGAALLSMYTSCTQKYGDFDILINEDGKTGEK